MAGIGVTLNRIFSKKSLFTYLAGFGYSTVITVAPMFVVIGAILGAQVFLGFSDVDYFHRELFSDTVLYIFIFSLLAASPMNSVLSRYLSDVIFKEQYQDIMPCFYVGLLMSMGLGCLVSVPFCIHEVVVGGVALYYVFTGYCGFMALLFTFYAMLYLGITKDYVKISLSFLAGMAATLGLAFVLIRWLKWEVTYSVLFSLVVGFVIIGAVEYAIIRSYFRLNSRQYREVLRYFKVYWKLILVNFIYTLGLYAHNFIFWATPMHTVLVKSFVTMMSYDMATCLAMFTNLSATVIFISRVEMHFHARYKAYSEAVIGGRGQDIRNTKRRMFAQMGEEIMSLVRVQFIITVAAFLVCIVFLPRVGFGGVTMQIYPCLCVGYYILFIMYGEVLFLYYFNELNGALLTVGSFLAVTVLGTLAAVSLPQIWYGMGLAAGAFTGFTVGYFRLKRIQRNLDTHVFCTGSLLPRGQGRQPGGKVFDRRAPTPQAPEQETARAVVRRETKKGWRK